MKQKGYILPEILVSLGIGGVILLSVVGSIFLIVRATPDVRERVVTTTELDRAVHWITRDIVMGQTSDLDNNALPVDHITINWMDYTKEAQVEQSTSHTLAYNWSAETGELTRNHNDEVTVVGKYLTKVEFSRQDRMIIITLTCSESGAPGYSVTRSYKLLLRGETGL